MEPPFPPFSMLLNTLQSSAFVLAVTRNWSALCLDTHMPPPPPHSALTSDVASEGPSLHVLV